MENYNKVDLRLSFTDDTLKLKNKYKNLSENTNFLEKQKLKTDTFFTENNSNEEYVGLTILTLIAILVISIFLGIKLSNPTINTTENNSETVMNIEKVDLIVK